MASRQARSRLIALLAVTSLLTLGFHQLGSNPMFAYEWSLTWIDAADPETALAALLRLTGLLCCYWVLISTTLYALTQHTGRVPRVTRWITAPVIRRLVDSSLAVSLAISALAMPAQPLMAAEDPEPVIALEIHADGIPVPHLQLGTMPPAAVVSDRIGETGSIARRELLTADNYVVVAGDNLWRVAANQIREAGRGEATEAMVVMYWRQLIDANVGSLRSGDPNLIYPGEILTLPKFEAQP